MGYLDEEGMGGIEKRESWVDIDPRQKFSLVDSSMSGWRGGLHVGKWKTLYSLVKTAILFYV